MLLPSGNSSIGPNGSPLHGPGAHPEYDASLLFWRMAKLHIDQDRLATDDPLLFRELQGRCTLCPSKQLCIRELGSDLFGTWTEYCANGATLNLLEALECCSSARLVSARAGDALGSRGYSGTAR